VEKITNLSFLRDHLGVIKLSDKGLFLLLKSEGLPGQLKVYPPPMASTEKNFVSFWNFLCCRWHQATLWADQCKRV